MRAVLWVVMVAGCGRIGFDAAATCEEPWGTPVELSLGATGLGRISITNDERELAGSVNGQLFALARSSASASWGPPIELPSPPNQLAWDDVDPTWTGDALTLYFTSFRFGGAYIMRTTRSARGGIWTAEVDTTLRGQADVRSDDLEIFTQDYQGPILHATRSTRAIEYSNWVELDPVINDGSQNLDPSISPDGLELYFRSNRSGSDELWVARRASLTSPFTSVEPVGFPGEAPDISSDSRHMYLSRPDGAGYRYFVASRCE